MQPTSLRPAPDAPQWPRKSPGAAVLVELLEPRFPRCIRSPRWLRPVGKVAAFPIARRREHPGSGAVEPHDDERWRTWLTRHLIDRWLTNHRFRQLRFLQSEDRNPEYPNRRGCVLPRQTRRSDGGLIAHSAAQRRHLRRHPVGCRRRSRRRDPWPRADRAKISGDHGGHPVANTVFKLVRM